MPNSVVHYTSLEVVSILLNGAISSTDANITLHLSQLSMMNDSGEGYYVLDRFYTDSYYKRQLKQKWDSDFYPNHIPFVFSTIATNIYSRNQGSLPMWKMYGDDCKGALIRFKFDVLKKYCDKKGYLFSQCSYLASGKVENMVKEFNKKKATFDEIMRKSCLTKRICWEYEKEWRIVIYANKNDVKVKKTGRGLVEYIELELPIELIEEISLGPLCDKDSSIQSVMLLKEKLDTYSQQASAKLRNISEELFDRG